MPSGAQPPLVAIYNNLETFYRFLSRAEEDSTFRKRKYRGDRALFWCGDPKLVFMTAPIPDARLICELWGYPGTLTFAPAVPTHQLCLDIQNETRLLERIVQHAGPERTIQLIPYAATAEFFQLVDTLSNRHGLTVLTPESPRSDHLWLRDYVDSKAGFRSLATQWLGETELFPAGFVCRDVGQAVEAVAEFLRGGRACVVKADEGEGGIGQLIFSPGDTGSYSVAADLGANPYLRGGLILVEEYIRSSAGISPSFEYFVPPAGEGAPRLTYASQQLFSASGRFDGVLISRSLHDQHWYAPALEHGSRIAEGLQELGYAGFFDVDTIVDDRGHLYLLELNARRTGGTFVHEFACRTLGEDYLDRVAILSSNSVDSSGIHDAETLLSCLGELCYPRFGPGGGVVVSVTSTLVYGKFGCILVAADEWELRRLDRAMRESLQACQCEPDRRVHREP